MIEQEIYEQLFEKDEQPVGEIVNIGNISYKIIGVYKNGNISFDGAAAYIPFSTFQQVYNRANRISWMMITANEGIDILQMEQDILLTLKNIHKVDPEDKRAFGSANLAVEIGKITGFLTGMQFLTWFVGIATLIAGVFAIGNILLITVKDTGRGIHPDDLPNVFNRFYQTKRKEAASEGGTGIGLALSKEFVKLMKGKIWIESKEGVGTTVFFTLPESPIKEMQPSRFIES